MEIPKKIPTHVSLIMDGNGRWARERGEERIVGHREGVESVRAVLESCVNLGIKYVSFYAFSEENWDRPENEVSYLMKLMGECMKSELPLFIQNNVRFRVIGNLDRLSGSLRSIIDETQRLTASNTAVTMILFMSYSGKWDILQAAEKMAHDLKNNPARSFSAGDFELCLATAGIPDPDLLIRTSGEKRLSNYLLWQCAYTEFVFTDVLWPDFRQKEFLLALKEYSERDRRFGKVK